MIINFMVIQRGWHSSAVVNTVPLEQEVYGFEPAD